jgi:toluene monooxygenase system ferredoxin subunit
VRALASAERELLSEARFFEGLSAAQIERIAGLGRVCSYPQDTRVYVIGDAVDNFYVLAEGMVRFTLGFGKRETRAGEIMRRGDVFGWAALVEGHPHRIATAHCLTACVVVALHGAQLHALMESDHSLGYAIMKKLAVLLTSELATFAAG